MSFESPTEKTGEDNVETSRLLVQFAKSRDCKYLEKFQIFAKVTQMGRKSKGKQAAPEALVQDISNEKTKLYVRSGGKRKYVGDDHKKLKVEDKKGKGKVKDAAIDTEEALEATRAAYFNPEDLVEPTDVLPGDMDTLDAFEVEDEQLDEFAVEDGTLMDVSADQDSEEDE